METVESTSLGKGFLPLTVLKRAVKIYTIAAVTRMVMMTVKITELVSKIYVLCKVLNSPIKKPTVRRLPLFCYKLSSSALPVTSLLPA